MHAKHLASEGLEVGVLTFSYDPAHWSERLAGVPVEVVRKWHWADPFFGTGRLARLRRRSQRPDVSSGRIPAELRKPPYRFRAHIGQQELLGVCGRLAGKHPAQGKFIPCSQLTLV